VLLSTSFFQFRFRALLERRNFNEIIWKPYKISLFLQKRAENKRVSAFQRGPLKLWKNLGSNLNTLELLNAPNQNARYHRRLKNSHLPWLYHWEEVEIPMLNFIAWKCRIADFLGYLIVGLD
jgi:hypothetical protein